MSASCHQRISASSITSLVRADAACVPLAFRRFDLHRDLARSNGMIVARENFVSHAMPKLNAPASNEQMTDKYLGGLPRQFTDAFVKSPP